MPAVVDFNYLSLNWWVSRISGCHPTLSTSPSFGWNFARSYRSSKATRCYSSSWAQALEKHGGWRAAKPQLWDAWNMYSHYVSIYGISSWWFQTQWESSPSRGEHKKMEQATTKISHMMGFNGESHIYKCKKVTFNKPQGIGPLAFPKHCSNFPPNLWVRFFRIYHQPQTLSTS